MKKYVFAAAISAFAIMGASSASAQAQHDGSADVSCATVVPSERTPALFRPEEASARELGCAVAAWQLNANRDLSYIDYQFLQSSYGRGWVQATFYIGLDRFAAATNDPWLLTQVRQFAFVQGFELGDRPWHGDDQAIAAVYANLSMRENDPSMVQKSAEQFDRIMEQNYTNSLEFVPPPDRHTEGTCQVRWCWADAIFMAPPSWALVTEVTGDDRYLDYAASETRAVIEYLQDPETGLLYRDSRYFDAETENGKGVFWSRGNGWVFAGLARFIEAMPEDHPERQLMIDTFVTLADTLVSIQREDGYWPTSLLDPEMLTNPETSGTAFFGFGLAWGLNNGILEGDQYVSARDRAWDAIRTATSNSGMVGWVQQVGRDPQSTTAGTSQLYATGGALLFASEMLDHH